MFASIARDSPRQALCGQPRRYIGPGLFFAIFREQTRLLLFWCKFWLSAQTMLFEVPMKTFCDFSLPLLFWCNFWLSAQTMLFEVPMRTFCDFFLPTRAVFILASTTFRLTGDLWTPCLPIPHLFPIFVAFARGRLCWLHLSCEPSRNIRQDFSLGLLHFICIGTLGFGRACKWPSWSRSFVSGSTSGQIAAECL